ncbi:MAG: beta-phosphoglucomutase [Deltaproteobacteria bacterium CG_4_10_14_3_um_filter_60_8]|nr:MAG: beta-phosphoglucomutase [Desulfobacterales bacterium CG2_30_60_27]PIY22635.1 MAG: beta-phosphoglucomutase [Deltaproteobacteria bacterium CG_4_10_14_3_um_filter_60_8]
MKIKLVIFDCDGVMFDSREANRHFYNHLLAGLARPPMDEAELDYVHMNHVQDSVRHIFRHYPGDLAAAEALRQQVDYRDFIPYMLMEPDLVEFLELLAPTYKTAISTNRTTTMAMILDIFGLTRYFGKVVTPLDVTRPKPHPESLLKILDHYGLAVDQAVYIGDSRVDQEPAAAIGMAFIAFKNPTLTAAHHVNSFMEIARLPALMADRPGSR